MKRGMKVWNAGWRGGWCVRPASVLQSSSGQVAHVSNYTLLLFRVRAPQLSVCVCVCVGACVDPQPLPRDSVLGRILQVQLLDSLDIEGLLPLYRRVEQYLHHFPKER